MSETIGWLKSLDYSPLWISLKTGVVATVLSFFLGVWAASLAVRKSTRFRAVLDGILTLPLVLPPTVAGFILLRIFSLRRPVGGFLYEAFGFKAVHTWAGCILAATVIAFPLMYRNARGALEQVDRNLLDAARTLGLSEREIFFRITLPLAKPGLLAGTVLTFARAMGEYGATSMLAGNIPGKTGTISQRIAMVVQDGDYLTAGFWTVLVVVTAFILVTGMNLWSGRK